MSEIQSTQDKYRRAQKNQEPAQIKENEVRITTGGRVKNYVDYATRLFEGTNNENRNNNNNNNDDNGNNDDNANTGDNNDDNNNNNTQSRGPSKKFDSIVLKATGKAINKAVTTAEIVKRTIGDLHQETAVETLEIVDVWEPTEEGLQKVETTRRVASISIKLSRNVELVDTNAAGYQKPIPKETGFNLGGRYDRRGPRGPYRGGGRDNRRGPGGGNRGPRGNRGPGNQGGNQGQGGGYGGNRNYDNRRRGGYRGGRGRGGPRNNRNFNNNRGGGGGFGGNYPYRGQGGGNRGGPYGGNQGGPYGGNRGGFGSPGNRGPRNDGRRRGGRGGPRRGGYY